MPIRPLSKIARAQPAACAGFLIGCGVTMLAQKTFGTLDDEPSGRSCLLCGVAAKLEMTTPDSVRGSPFRSSPT
jgi:hypothetical protein